ncbi:helix-turn-helix domain-containing protein [Eubacterium sp. 1001713B170207_170306_E7]|uniref:helix-turn-helix domain-containing protein n=1 Tax=Eubacterium sp. 1001713B170207_170306_E7 TaxID=2787097 RepID=UPI0018995305|nr:helix-turn-helix domain-containing protein [Eubacterium sp. 1001713B170207_170306_E7]
MNDKKKGIENSGWSWFFKTSVIWILSILFFTFLIYRYAGGMLPPEGQAAFNEILLKISVLTIIIGLFLNFFILQNYYIAISRIVGILDENTSAPVDDYYATQNPAGHIFQLFDQFHQEYDTYKSMVEQQQDILFENFLVRLLKGHIQNEAVHYQLMEDYDFDIRNNEFVLVLFDIVTEDDQIEDDKLRYIYAFIKENFSSYMKRIYQSYGTEVDGRIAFFILSDVASLDTTVSAVEIERMVKLMRENIWSRFSYDLWVCVSSVNRGIPGCKTAYFQTVETLQKARLTGSADHVLFYSDYATDKPYRGNEQLWFKYEHHFINAINAGDYEEASKIFNKLLKNDYITSASSLNLARFRLFGLLNSMINALGEVRLSMNVEFFDELDAQRLLLECKSLPELEAVSQSIFEKINQYSAVGQVSASDSKMQRVSEYLKDHYSDCNLNAVAVAEEFNMNPSYFSRSFKKAVGTGFSDYLSRLRIQEACRLLKESDRTISDIAEEIGYNNALTLSRAFKKIEGTTPGQYRQSRHR